ADSRAAGREAQDWPEVLDLTAAVAASRPRRVQRAGGVERERRRGRNADGRASIGRLAPAGHVHLGGETRRQPHLRVRGGRRHEREHDERDADHPFTPPAVRPSTTYFCRTLPAETTGSVA